MSGAVLLNLVIAALVGVFVPLGLTGSAAIRRRARA